MINNGTRIGIDQNIIYPKKLGIFIFDDSAIALTIKFGALPIYEFAPIKTAPRDIASRVSYISVIRMDGSPPAVLKKTK